jgi:hypothetical protein
MVNVDTPSRNTDLKIALRTIMQAKIGLEKQVGLISRFLRKDSNDEIFVSFLDFKEGVRWLREEMQLDRTTLNLPDGYLSDHHEEALIGGEIENW